MLVPLLPGEGLSVPEPVTLGVLGGVGVTLCEPGAEAEVVAEGDLDGVRVAEEDLEGV